MPKSMISRVSVSIIITFSILLFFTTLISCETKDDEKQENPYYSFAPSTRGMDYKSFKHNIFGFSIDIPSKWTFGVNGTPPTAIILIYHENIATEVFSEDYETFELGQMPFEEITLFEAYKYTMIGMKQKHANIIEESKTEKGTIQNNNTLSWIYRWKSKTGFTITEYITLIKYKDSIRSVAVRTTREDFNKRKQYYDDIITTYVPHDPIY